MMKHPLSAVLAFYFLTGCAISSSAPVAPTPSPISSPRETSNPSAAPEARAKTWRIIPTSASQTYTSVLASSIHQSDGSDARDDSLIVTSTYSISIQRSADTISITGSINDFRIDVHGRLLSVDSIQPKLPLSFTGKITTTRIRLQTTDKVQSQTLCDDISQTPLGIVQRNVFTIPIEVTNEQSWRDSTTSAICNGSLPISVTTLRSYQLIGTAQLDGVSVLVIDQKERALSSGEGSQGQHRIFIQTLGNTTRRLYADKTSGLLIASKAESKVELSIQSSGRVQHFIQTSTEILTKSKQPLID
ncbi:MAG TPA: hypothetical protein VFC35_09630 [Gemmatimonadaceae bacterium]|nr:hypothetical protein [Gemmatimonadaceae bacterium]